MSFQDHLEFARKQQEKKMEEQRAKQVPTKKLLERMEAAGQLNLLALKIKNQ